MPTDSLGRKCGIDSAVTDRPYLFFFDLAKCVDPTVPFVGCDTTQVCVRQCPQTKFLFDRNECLQTGNFTGIIDSLICQLDVDKRQLRNCNDIEAKINENKCARWYLESKSCKYTELDRSLISFVLCFVYLPAVQSIFCLF